MKYNYNKSNIVISTCAVLFFCGLYLIFLCKIVTRSFNGLENWVLVLLYSPYLFAMAWTELQIETRKCKITKSGISVKYLLSREKLLSWDQFQQICICFEPLKKRFIPPRFTDQEIICFILKTAKKNSWGFWNVYSKRYFRRILFIRCSEEVIKELQENCPTDILDLRKDKVYQNK